MLYFSCFEESKRARKTYSGYLLKVIKCIIKGLKNMLEKTDNNNNF